MESPCYVMSHDTILVRQKASYSVRRCHSAGGCECCQQTQSRQSSQSSNEQSKLNNRAISVDQSLIMHKKAAESQKHRQFASARATYVLAAAVLSTNREQSTTPSCDSRLSPLDARKLRCLGQASPRSAPWRRAMRSTCRLPRHPHPAGGL